MKSLMKKEKVCACNDEKCACGKKNILVIAIITLAVLLIVVGEPLGYLYIENYLNINDIIIINIIL